jgi:hypothetical protein
MVKGYMVLKVLARMKRYIWPKMITRVKGVCTVLAQSAGYGERVYDAKGASQSEGYILISLLLMVLLPPGLKA